MFVLGTNKLSNINYKNNTVKFSYSCMPNFQQDILIHNRLLLQDRTKTNLQSRKCATADIEENAL